MIEKATGNLLHADVEALVNAVNCIGIMGRGIALQFKNEFPANFAAYRNACKRSEVRPGRMFIFDLNRITNPRFVINFPTKRHWKENSRMEDIQAGLTDLAVHVANMEIRSIAIPPLGCGLGGLSWSVVLPMIEKAFENLRSVRVLLFEPANANRITNAAKS